MHMNEILKTEFHNMVVNVAINIINYYQNIYYCRKFLTFIADHLTVWC